MAMPDIGLAPPPPGDVSAQMKPSAGAPPQGIGALMSGMAGAAPPPIAPDITMKVMEVEPMLTQLARQVPALGPDVDRLNVELQSRMGGVPAAFASLMGGAPASPPIGAATQNPIPGAAGPVPPVSQPAAPPVSPMPALPPTPLTEMGAMDTAMQLEIKLPPLGKDDPTLTPYIQGFIARMREEVPKVVQGETEAVSPPPQVAPTDSMLSKIPVTA